MKEVNNTTPKTLGRPFLIPEERRDKRIQVRVTEEELKLLNKQAHDKGLTQANYVRKLLGFDI